jgi:hypothetical protein
MMIRNRCALRRIPTTLLALCSSAYQASTFKKGCDDVDAAARTKPRVSPGTRRGAEERDTPDALQEGMAAPLGVTASVPAFRQGFLLTPKKNHAPDTPSHSTKLAAHQLAPPRSCNHHRRLTVTKVVRPTETEKGIRKQGAAGQRTRGRARPPPPMAVTDRTQQQEQTRPSGPAEPAGS